MAAWDAAGKWLRALLIPLALLCVAIVRLAGGRIRLGLLMADRIGHLAGNTEVYLCEKKAGMRPSLDFWITRQPANEVLLRLYGKRLNLDRTGFLRIVMMANRIFRGFQKYEIGQPNMDRDIYNLFDKQEAHVRLSKAQYAQGQKQLQEMGIEGGARHVCLIVRDSAYLPELEYHRYRDSDIEDYAGAAQALAERGYYVIRMGAKVEKPMPTGNPRIIDYATLGLRTEFMDVFLGATCTFCISTGCGFDAIPYVFRRPICYVNYVPVEYLFTFARYSVAIWKHHLRSDGRRMTMPEIIASGAGHFMTADEFAEAGITLQSNSPAEIRDAVLEMADIAEGAATSGPSQAWFWDAFPRSRSKVTGMPLHGKIRMRIGARFLEQYTHPQEKAA